MKKRLLTLCMALVLCLSLLAFGASAGGYSFSGRGTAEDPFQLKTASDFLTLANHINAGNPPYSTSYYVLMADITTPVDTIIGNSSYMFQGHFDGAGHTVTLAINQTSADYVGLFGYLGSGGEIKNVNTVGSVNGYKYVGAVCGYNEGGTISGCSNAAAVTGGNNICGGICGYNDGGKIINCCNSGKITGEGSGCGGVCGFNNTGGTVTNCYNSGGVSGTDYLGGVCSNNAGTVTECYYDSTTSGTSLNPIGTGLTTETMKAASGTTGALVDRLNKYITDNSSETAGWTKWAILSSGGYPELHDHVCDQCAVGDDLLKTPATCVTPAIYYKSCVCGYCDKETAGTFYDSGAQLTGHGAWKYNADGNILTVKCGNDGCTEPISAFLVLNAADKVYDGNPAAATISNTDAWKAYFGDDSVPAIEYYDSTDAKLDAAPKDAGTYTAKITAGEAQYAATASVTFSITKVIPVPTQPKSSYVYNGYEQNFELSFDRSYLDTGFMITGITSRADVSDEGYQMTAVLVDKTNTTWSDGTTEDKVFTFYITKAPLIVQAMNLSAAVGDPAPDLSAPVKGTHYTILQGGSAVNNDMDNEHLSITLTASPDMDVAGSYDIEPSVTGSAEGNYSITLVNGVLTVSTAKTVPIPTGATYIYCGKEQTFMKLPEYTAWDDTTTTADYDSSSGDFTGTAVGEYHIVLSLSDSNSTWSDGTKDAKTITFNIDPAPLIIAVKDKTASVDDSAAPTLSEDDYTFLRSPVTADLGKITVTLNYCNLDMNQAGTYEIQATVGGDPAKNYDITVATGSLVVTDSAAPYVIGDLNGDGLVTSKDVIILARHIADWNGYKTLPVLDK